MSTEPVSPSPDPELNAIEAALGSLVPARSRIDRDLVMFRAGQASVRPSRTGLRAWNAIAASLALIAFGEGVLLAHRRPPQIVERVVVVREPVTAPAPAPVPVVPAVEQRVAEVPEPLPSERSLSLGQTAYERLTAQVMRYGLDGLPASPTVASPDSGPWPAASGQMLQEELRKLLDPGDPS
jgi:hypothetical protein